MTAGKALTDDQHLALLNLLKIGCTTFWGPDRETCRKMLDGDFFHPLDTLGTRLVTNPADAATTLKVLLKSHFDAEALYADLEQAYVTLFINARGGIVAPLYQSCYAGSDDPQNASTLMGPAAVKMQKRLADLGLALDHSSNEPPDHLAIELEYLYFLLHRAWMENTPDALLEAAAFTRAELLEWLPHFEKRLQANSPNSFYALTATVLVGTLRLVADD